MEMKTWGCAVLKMGVDLEVGGGEGVYDCMR